jgi:isopentenyldiphosphate isomerase
MKLKDLLQQAKKEIIVIGVLPIEKEIIENSKEIANLFHRNSDFKLSIYHESDSDLFARSLYLDSKSSSKRISFKELQNKISRIDRFKKSFLSLEEDKMGNRGAIINDSNLVIRQLNLKHTINVVKVDDKIYTSEVLLDIPSLDDYAEVEQPVQGSQEKIAKYTQIEAYIKFISDEKKGGIYLSDPNDDDEELIEMYDKEDIPRGIFPRKAFYNTDFQRYSVWIFVFNRKGQLMLHQRTDKKIAKDNAGLWDKSAGGHVNITDRSSNEAAEREIIEEMYLADAEYTKYLTGNTQKFINLGEWRPIEREEEQVLNLLTRMKSDEWGYFSLKPAVKRVSKRRFIKVVSDETGNSIQKSTFRDTKFISDIFFFIAPEDEINDDEALKKIPSQAAKDRSLIDIRKLLDWVEDEKEEGNAEDVFTDDLIYIADQYKDILLGFADYLKFFFKINNG